MAVEKKEKKRKATTVSGVAPAINEQPSKKPKKSATAKIAKPDGEAGTTEPAKLKSAKGIDGSTTRNGLAAVASADDKPARKIKERKRAADFLGDGDDEDVHEEPSKLTESKQDPSSKPAKKKSEAATEPEATNDKKKTASGSKPAKKARLLSNPSLQETHFASDSNNESGEEDEDDQTDALIKGFESSGDEDASEDGGFKAGQQVPEIPDAKQIKRKLRKKEKRNKVEPEQPEQRGVVYVGHIPHGFYEHEMRAYFSQFGPITQLRLSRNRTTGRSKHFAFIEFASASVARVVADTMNSYLMFGHILRCEVVPPEKVHPATFKGANRRFKRTPWNKIEKWRLEAGKTKEEWQRKIKAEEKRRTSKAEKMKALGYEMEVPKLKGAEEAPVELMQVQVGGGEADQVKALEGPSEQKKESEKPAAEEGEAAKDVEGKTEQAEKKKTKKPKDQANAVNDATVVSKGAAKDNKKEAKESKKSKKVDKSSKKSVKV